MSGNDPFAEPDDSERTVIRPNPGGRRPAAAQPAAPQYNPPPPSQGYAAQPAEPLGVPAAPAPQQAAKPAAGDDLAMTGMNTLTACAATLFSLVSRIRNRAQHLDPDALRRSVVAEIRAFETRTLQAQIDPQAIKVARYAICATLDDVVLNTPWGEQSVWAMQSMVGTFHRETVGGDRFYDLLARLEQEPAKNIDLLEFLYMCLSLGFEGRLRVEPGGTDKHLNIRNGLARIIRAQRGPVESDLSPHWQGVDKPHRPLSAWKAVWIAAGCLAAILAVSFAGLSWALGNSAGRLIGQLSAVDTGAPPELFRKAPPPPPPPPTVAQEQQMEAVKGFLKQEIDEGIVTVFQDANTITVRIAGSGMFGSGSDVLKDEFQTPLERVAQALDGAEGPILIAGHSDNQPIRTARFPSNEHLSLARAEAVKTFIAGKLKDPTRLTAEGRADKEPIEPNDTREGRAANRRIEIILVRADG
ncbi:MAG: type VI secretion system protein TssL, long form [Pseudomonadota bacterium]